ncbi:MAG: peptidylprolyl isomerase [Chloroflexota bacterium]|nr:peptidylprolyl isomerase [Chloroflexota bacterium]
MAKKKKGIINRKSHARIERERIQKRYITIGTIVVIALVIGIAVFGIVKEGFIEPNQPVVTVNGREISKAQFQAWTRYKRFQLVSQYANYFNFMKSFGDENSAALFEKNLRQIQFQLEPVYMGANVLDQLTQSLLVQQEAERRGIKVSEKEIDTYIAEIILHYYPDGTPTPIPTREMLPTSTLSSAQLTLVPPMATSETEVSAQPTPTEIAENPETDPTTVPPTPTPYPENYLQETMAEYVQYVNGIAKISEEDIRWVIENQLYQDKVMAAITAGIESQGEQIWARHILVKEEDEAAEVLDRIEAGEDFAELAQELSIDTGSGANGGDLGWFGANQMVAEFEAAAFDLEIGEISPAVETDFGWHIIQLLGREARQIPSDRLEKIKQQAFQQWLNEQRDTADVVIAENWGDFVPEEPTIPQQMLLPTMTPRPTAIATPE